MTTFQSLALLQQAQAQQQQQQHHHHAPQQAQAHRPAATGSAGGPNAGTATASGSAGGSSGPPEKKKRRRTAEDGKRYPCDFEGCGKDHLSRHKLNHNPTQVYECSRCPKTFVRMDLLVRHTERHERKERGEEPADTARKVDRKRAGSVSGPGGAGAASATTSMKKYDIPAMPAGPPSSAAVYAADQNTALQQSIFNALPGSTVHIPPMPAFPHIPNHDLNVHTPSSATYSTLSPHALSAHSGSPADNAFSNPQTAPSSLPSGPSPPGGVFASSLVIPTDFAGHTPDGSTMSAPTPQPAAAAHQPSPGGLSLVDQALAAGHALAQAQHQHHQHPPPQHHPTPPQPHPVTHHSPFAFNANPPLHPMPSHHDFEEPFNFLSTNYGAPFASNSDYSWLFAPDQSFDVHFAASRPASPGAGSHDFLAAFGQGGSGIPGTQTPARLAAVANALGGHGNISSQLDKVSQQLEATEQQQQQQQQQALDLLGLHGGAPGSPVKLEPVEEESSMDLTESIPNGYHNSHDVVPDPNDATTFVDDATRTRVLDYLGSDWSHLRDDPRLGVQQMAYYLALFWVKVHETQAPAVHRASFRPAAAPTPLLLSMMLVGSYFAPAESYQLAVQLHPWFRGKVLCSPDFRPRSEVWLMQTMLLIVVFGKLCSTRMDHEMAHIFQSSFIQLGRRSGLFSQRAIEIPLDKEDDIDFLWHAWIEEEVSKRLAQIVFALDVEHAAFFRHAHTLSAFQIQLPLPCDEDQWEASTAHEWKQLHDQQRQPIQFISALKASLTAVNEATSLNPFSRIAVLHGLLSVAQDLQWRDHVLGFSSPERRSQNWRDMISSAYNLWKQRLDEALVHAPPATTQLLRASISLYATAQITFSIDIHELQIYAGAETAAGLIVSPAVFHATEQRIRMWSGSREGRASTWHAVHFLRSCLQHWRQSTADLAGCLHHRWTVYLAFLAVYAFGRSTSGHPAPPSANHQEAAMRYLDGMCTGTPDGLLAVSNKHNCLDLCMTVQEYIRDTRWEVVQDAARILHKLIKQQPGTPAT
ncbi:hypothetical protein Rhopal_003715-T1 [Rhodotorula paludigena]|uniref:C2H2-type domain-containing protein n=1 Tax=Rhodotorula paludigena TaxID=86838 RepID=A0AAV5GME6_9BASI|nr:hypothetical protein Rhopal_003715-T1 [Rhodotorula paludigena]